MVYLLSSMARYLCIAFGTALLYFSYTMTEVEEGVWTNRLEAAWVKIDDRSKNIRSTSLALFETVSMVIESALDKVYGRKLLTPKALIIPYMLSIAALFLLLGVISVPSMLLSTLKDPSWNSVSILLFCIVFCFGIAILFWWLAQKILRSVPFQIVALVGFILLPLLRGLKEAREAFEVIVTVLGAIISMALIAVIRKTLLWMAADVSTPRIAIALIIQLAVVTLLVGVPFANGVQKSEGQLSEWLIIFGFLNLSTVLAALSFSIAVAVLLVHRVMWPLLSRWAYVFTRPDVLNKRKLVRTVGWSCLSPILAGNHVVNFLKNLLQ